jgi:hypothetical protein
MTFIYGLVQPNRREAFGAPSGRYGEFGSWREAWEITLVFLISYEKQQESGFSTNS